MFADSDAKIAAAQSNFKMWQSLGFALQFGLVNTTIFAQTVTARCVVLLAAAVLSLICFSALAVRGHVH